MSLLPSLRLGGALKRRIAYGCLGLLGTTSVAGAVQLEINGQIFSTGFEKVRESVSKVFSHKPDLSSWTVTGDTFKIFKDVGGWISEGAQQVWQFMSGTVAPYIASINTQHLDPLYGVQNFFTSIFDPNIFHRIFDNLHIKIWNVLSFSINGQNRSTFLSLFEEGKRDSSLKAAKFLLGLPIDGNKNLKAQSNVFNYLLTRWMDEPEKVTEKFQKLSETIESWTKKFTSSGGRGGSDSEGSNHVYELDIKTLEEYLQVPDGWSETLYKTLWAGEILTKIKTGNDLTFGSKSWILNWNQ